MALGPGLVACIGRAVDRYGPGRPIPAAELRGRLEALDLVPDEDYEEFVGRWGGCFVGVSVHVWDNASILGRESCIELTAWARDAHGALIDGVVIADDGSGNPIWIASNGAVCLVDHDNGNKVVQLAPDFKTLLEDNVHD
ncbi:SMI1/KNR4 family protein [Micromonospora sp. NPDC020750]|uniref:SMI1/KNR4 family protein n=1 Tax=unclassified Micromonospora TaxID=2617518 RepID=UPI00379BC40D